MRIPLASITFSVIAVALLLPCFALAKISPSIPSQGLIIDMEDGLPTITKVYDGTAGMAAGFQVGDVILAVGLNTTAGMTPRDIGYMLDFNPGSTVGVAVLRNDATKYLFLARRQLLEQWKIARQQDQREAALDQRAEMLSAEETARRERERRGTLSYSPGQITYTSSSKDVDAYDSGGAFIPTSGIRSGQGSITYETLYAELQEIRQQLESLNQAVDGLSEQVQSLKAEEKALAPSYKPEPKPKSRPTPQPEPNPIIPQEEKNPQALSIEEIQAEIDSWKSEEPNPYLEEIENPNQQLPSIEESSELDIIKEWESSD